MIPPQLTYTPDQVKYLLQMQHIATRNACIATYATEYDYNESINVGRLADKMQGVLFAYARIDESEHYYNIPKT